MSRPSNRTFALLLSPLVLGAASCDTSATGDSAAAPTSTPGPATGGGGGEGPPNAGNSPVTGNPPFDRRTVGSFDEPWALAFAPGTSNLFVTERPGTMKFVDTRSGQVGTVTGLPEVDYGGQGGLGDVAFLQSESKAELGGRTIYLSWAEAGSGDTRGAVVGRGTLECGSATSCNVEGLQVIWRQDPKVTGRGHYSHKIAFSPDEQYMYVASGDRQKQDPAQDTSNTLGSIVRLNLDGSPASGNPLAGQSGASDEIWSYGHRNTLGLQFDTQGRLWNLEHGPAGGDELNLVERGVNYGWPVVSYGDNYNGSPIPRHPTRPEFREPAIYWTPVIAPGDFIFYSGNAFDAWRGDAVIANLKVENIVIVDVSGNTARQTARYSFDRRLRDIAQAPDGTIWIAADGDNAPLYHLTPKN